MNSENTLQNFDSTTSTIKDLIANHWIDLLELNFLILICCIPILTIPLGLICTNRVIVNLINKRACFIWDVFKEEFMASFRSGLILGLLIMPMECMILILVTFIKPLSTSISGIIIISVFLFVIIWNWIVFSYSFLMKATVQLGIPEIIRNAIILSITQIKKNLIVCIPLLIFFLVLLFSPYSLTALLFLPVATQILICKLYFPIIKEKSK